MQPFLKFVCVKYKVGKKTQNKKHKPLHDLCFLFCEKVGQKYVAYIKI